MIREIKKYLSMHSCKDVLQKVNLALDGELSEGEMKSFLIEVDNCSHCFQSYDTEKAFKEFLINRIEKKPMPSASKIMLQKEIMKSIGLGR
ncbi:MAG: anti-sigma factor (TIGR02949 family) [Limisphaerales bacterium]|jgi:anti-sigma factor (TIGR02949 family)